MSKVTTSFTMDDIEDRDLLIFLNRLPRRRKSEAIRRALRAQIEADAVTLGDVYQAINALARVLARERTPDGSAKLTPDDHNEEPPGLADPLDSLGL